MDASPFDLVEVVHGVSWAEFTQRAKTLEGHRFPRLAYADGTLLLMGADPHHERAKRLFEALFLDWAGQEGVVLEPLGLSPVRADRQHLALEPDSSFQLGAFRVDDLPDLVMGVGADPRVRDHSRTICGRLGLEFWWLDTETLQSTEPGDSLQAYRPTGSPSRASRLLPVVDLPALGRAVAVGLAEGTRQAQRALRGSAA